MAAALAAFLWLRVGPARAGAVDAAPPPGARRRPRRHLRGGARSDQRRDRAVVPAALAQAAPLQALEPLILGLESRGSYDGALATIEALWGGTPVFRTPLRTHLEHLRVLDLPVVLEMFHPARRQTCFVALLGLRATRHGGRWPHGYPLRVSVDELDRLWTRDAVFLWQDFERSRSRPRRAAAWARDMLGSWDTARRDCRRWAIPARQPARRRWRHRQSDVDGAV